MCPKLDADGYPSVTLRRDGGKMCKCVHQLIALAWLPPRPSPEHQVAHWDGNRLNSAPSNLRWATPLENAADMLRHGTSTRGERHPQAKLNDDAVRAIRGMRAAGATFSAIGKEFGVAPSAAWKAATGQRWGHVQ